MTALEIVNVIGCVLVGTMWLAVNIFFIGLAWVSLTEKDWQFFAVMAFLVLCILAVDAYAVIYAISQPTIIIGG